MRIVHITGWYPQSGDPQLGVFIQKQVNALQQLHQQAVFCVGQHPPAAASWHADIALHHVLSRGGTLGNLQFLASVKTVVKQMRRFRPDVVHVHIPTPKSMILAGFMNPCPLLISEHWSGYLRPLWEALPVADQRKRVAALNKARVVVVPHVGLAERLQQLGVNARLAVVPNVIERYSGPDLPRSQRVLMVADLDDANKRLSPVMRAFHHLNKPGWTMRVVGDGPDMEPLRRLAEDCGVEMAGRMGNADVLRELAQCAFVVVNSRVETFGMVAAEALLAGTPVLCTRCGGPEQFMGSDAGVLMPVENDNQLQTALGDMMERYAGFDTHHAATQIEAVCSPAAVAEALTALYTSADVAQG
jgi:glycosyltransferase involved in cell wall biosynthesis